MRSDCRAHDTYKVSLELSSAAGQIRSGPRFPCRRGKGSGNRDERQAGPAKLLVSQMARRAPLGHVVVRRPMSCHQPATSADCVIRRTPATEPLGGTIGIPSGIVGHRVDMRTTVLGPALAWAGSVLGASCCVAWEGKPAGARNQRAVLPNRETQAFLMEGSLRKTSS